LTAECRVKKKVCQVVKMTGISGHAEIYCPLQWVLGIHTEAAKPNEIFYKMRIMSHD
jgi:hypothetical protein